MEIFNVLLIIVSLFLLFLVIKSFMNKQLKEKFCVICTSVFLSWFFLLILYWFGNFTDTVLIALLMGGSIVGFYYLLEKKVSDNLKVFRLPFLLFLFILGYAALTKINQSIYKSITLIVVLFILGILLLLYKKNKRINSLINKIINCCKSW